MQNYQKFQHAIKHLLRHAAVSSSCVYTRMIRLASIITPPYALCAYVFAYTARLMLLVIARLHSCCGPGMPFACVHAHVALHSHSGLAYWGQPKTEAHTPSPCACDHEPHGGHSALASDGPIHASMSSASLELCTSASLGVRQQ